MKVKRSLRTLVSNIAPTITSMDGTSTEHDEKNTTDNEIKYHIVPPYTYSNHCYWDAVVFCPLKVMACGHVYVCDTPVFIGCQNGLPSVGLKINKYIHKYINKILAYQGHCHEI